MRSIFPGLVLAALIGSTACAQAPTSLPVLNGLGAAVNVAGQSDTAGRFHYRYVSEGLDLSGNPRNWYVDSNGLGHISIDASSVSAVPIVGGNTVAVKVDGSAVTQPISVVSLPLPSGSATSALQTTGNGYLASLAGIISGNALPVICLSGCSGGGGGGSGYSVLNSTTYSGTSSTYSNVPAGGAVTTGSPTYTSGQAAPVSLTTAGAIRTDGTATTQPVSATALPLPTGAATSALQTAGNTSMAADASYNAPFSGAVAMTVGSTYAAQRSIGMAVTVAGNVSLTLSNASTIVVPVNVGWNQFPFAVTAVNTSGTTATGVYSNLQ